ncbi:MAG: HEAT repeat domain-containing protein [Polyangiaceae bacterium]|nr:HEAT repeat domain-containing protein [Polyangiaceae bacterium]
MRLGRGSVASLAALLVPLAAVLSPVVPSRAAAAAWPSRGAQLERAMSGADPQARLAAVRAAAGAGPASARRILARAMQDEDPAVRLEALELARELRVAEVEDAAVAWLASGDVSLRRAAAEHFARRAHAAAVPALARALADPESAVRLAAVRALGRSGASTAVVPLLGRLDDPANEVRVAVVDALAALGDASAAVPLLARLVDSRVEVRAAVARSLGRLGEPSAVLPLVDALGDSDDEVRAAAAESLGRLGAATTEPALTRALGGASPRVAAAVAHALGRLGTAPAVAALVELLASTDDGSVAYQARVALARAPAEAAAPLQRCVAAAVPAPHARRCAIALEELRVASAAPLLVEAVRGGRFEPEALSALAAIGDPAALGAVLERLADDRAAVRHAAIEAAARLLDPSEPDGRAVEPLAAALRVRGRGLDEREALVVALGRTGAPRAAAVLDPFAREGRSPRLRLAAIEALGVLGAAGRVPAIDRALTDPDPAVRLAAGVALGRSGAAADARRWLDLAARGAADRGAVALAVAGILARVDAPEVVDLVERAARLGHGGERDAWIDALSRARGALAPLTRLLTTDPADRAKVAEALATRPGSAGLLVRLARDRDPAVRANAVWALGVAGGAEQLGALAAAIGDRDLAVSGSAVAALGRAAARLGRDERARLCRLIGDPRPYVRVNALAALAALGRRCDGGPELRALREEELDEVRAAAARLVVLVPGDRRADEAALEAAGFERPAERVRLARPAASGAPRGESVWIHVVPAGESEPEPRAAFALISAEGYARLGRADRRGVVVAHEGTAGALRLGVPAAFLR